MMRTPQRQLSPGPSRTIALALLLAAVAGFVDVCAYMSFGVYAANMTGNAISLAIGVSGRAGSAIWERACPIAIYFAGGLAGASLVGDQASGASERQRVRLLLPIEAVLIALVVVLGHRTERRLGPVPAGLALLALAAGLQNVSLHRIGPVTFRTTHITGRLTRCAELLAEIGTWFRRHGRGRSARRRLTLLRLIPRQPVARQAGLVFGLFVGFVAGACGGALALSAWGRLALAIPAIGLVLMAFIHAETETP